MAVGSRPGTGAIVNWGHRERGTGGPGGPPVHAGSRARGSMGSETNIAGSRKQAATGCTPHDALHALPERARLHHHHHHPHPRASSSSSSERAAAAPLLHAQPMHEHFLRPSQRLSRTKRVSQNGSALSRLPGESNPAVVNRGGPPMQPQDSEGEGGIDPVCQSGNRWTARGRRQGIHPLRHTQRGPHGPHRPQ